MAGDFAVAGTVGLDDLDPLWEAGLELDILIDLSHNVNFATVAGGTQVISKPIEIDMRVSRGTLQAQAWQNLLQNAAGVTKEIVDGIQDLGGDGRLDQSAVKVEIPNFGTDIFDPASPGDAEAPAVAACLANAQAFDAMEDWQRQYFGMYRWSNAGLSALEYEDEPRTRAG